MTTKAKVPTNPALFGTVWWLLHLQAKHATTDVKKNEFIDNMYLLSVEFPCGKCRSHIMEYLKEHSFDPYLNLHNEKGEDIGMFKWTWMFHNAVNIRLHKPFVDWETAWGMYDTGREVCTNCSSSRPNSTVNSVEPSYEDSFEDKKPAKKEIYVDKKTIIQNYFLKKH